MTTPSASDPPAWHARFAVMWEERKPEVAAAWEADQPAYEADWQRVREGIEAGWAADPDAAPADRDGYLEHARTGYLADKRHQHFSSAADRCAEDAFRIEGIEGYERRGVSAELQTLMTRETAGRPLASGAVAHPPGTTNDDSLQADGAGQARDPGNDVTR